MRQATDSEFRDRFDAYVTANLYLASNGTTVAERRRALSVRDAFESDMRRGVFEAVLCCVGVCDDPRIEQIDAGFRAIQAATGGDHSVEDLVVIDALLAGKAFAERLVSRELHVAQLIAERNGGG